MNKKSLAQLGEKNHMFGKHHSEEWKRKASETSKRLYEEGKIKPPSSKGKHHTEATKEKMRLSKLGERNPNFGKHNIPWNKGEKMSEEFKEKERLSHLGEKNNFFGKHHSEETKAKLKIIRNTPEAKEKSRLANLGDKSPNFGKKFPKHSERMKGERNPNWNNGSSFEPYGLEFNRKLKEQIRTRDNFRCQECFRHQDELFYKNGAKKKLSIHHIDFNKKNNNPTNLISLCKNCHAQTNFKREGWTKYFQEKINGVI